MYFDINSQVSGNVIPHFAGLDYAKNKLIMEESANQSKGNIDIPAAVINAAALYFNQVACKNKVVSDILPYS